MRVHSSRCLFCGFGHVGHDVIHHCSIAPSASTAHDALRSTGSPPAPPQPWVVSLSPSCCLSQRVAEVESHSTLPFQTHFFHLVKCI